MAKKIGQTEEERIVKAVKAAIAQDDFEAKLQKAIKDALDDDGELGDVVDTELQRAMEDEEFRNVVRAKVASYLTANIDSLMDRLLKNAILEWN